VPCHCHERRTRIDIVFEKTVEHVDAEVKECPSCHKETKGIHPADMHGPLQYGNGIKAYVIQFLIAQMVSLNRVQKMLTALIGRAISEATMLGYVLALYYALESWELNSIEKLLKIPSVNVDETSLRVDKKNQWIHVYAGGDITCKFLHKKRGIEAMEAINFIPRYGGTLKQQLQEKHVEPNSHLGRAIKYMLKHWKKLRRFLTTPGAPLDNNVVEAALKIPIRIRKSAMFYKTLHGATIGNILIR